MKTVRITIYTFVCLLACISTLEAATVTVGVGGTEDYATLKEAVDDHGAWSDATDDTIEVTDNGLNPIDADITLPTLTAALTFKNAAGDSPVFLVDTEFVAIGIFIQNQGGELTFDGLTFMGKKFYPLTGAVFNNTIIGAEAIPEGETLTVTIRNCFVTANTGTPVIGDRLETNPANKSLVLNNLGKCARVFRVSGDSCPGGLVLNLESSTFAHVAESAFPIDPPDSLVPSTVNATNCILWGGANLFPGPNVDLNVDECLIGGNGEGGEGGSSWGGIRATHTEPERTLTITDTVFNWKNDNENSGSALLRFNGSFLGTAILKRVTWASNNSKGIHCDDAPSEDDPNFGFLMPTANLHMEDVIFNASAEAAFRLSIGPYPAPTADVLFGEDNFSIKNFALTRDGGGDHPRLFADMEPWPETRGFIEAQMDALYEGTGPLYDEDPQFVTRVEEGASIDTAVIGFGWDRAANGICDVRNLAYMNRGTAGERFNSWHDLEGDDLSGGADFNYEQITAAEFSYMYR